MEVTSELLPFFQRDNQSQPYISPKNVISKFSFTCPPDMGTGDGQEGKLEKDDDGDYLVVRRNDTGNGDSSQEYTISLEHGISTELKLVGLQIWRGALLLADYIIHAREEFRGVTVLELGAGVGLTSVVAGMYAKRIICTDIDRGDILKLLKHNMDRNGSIVAGEVLVRDLDFFNTDWMPEMRKLLEETTVILAADVIYDNDVTEAFVRTIGRIMDVPPKKTLYIAMEKRYVFTLADLDTVAPCYEHFRTCLKESRRTEPLSRCRLEEVPLDFPQFFNYERVKELIMFRISI